MAANEDFTFAVNNWVRKAQFKTLAVVKATIKEINYTIIAEWPVETGYSRNAWAASIGTQDREPKFRDRRVRASATMSEVLSRLNRVADQMKLGQKYYLTNTAPYAMRIEYGFTGRDAWGRMYDQQGRFIVSRAKLLAKRIADTEALRVAALDIGIVR